MNSEQLKFYKVLESRLEKGEYLDVNGYTDYVSAYIYRILAEWERFGFEQLSEHLIYVSELYKSEEKISKSCRLWSVNCLLGLERFEEYLDQTEPEEAFGTNTHGANLRLNIQKHIDMSANPVDLVLMASKRKTKFLAENGTLFKEKLSVVFEDYEKKHGNWFLILESWISDRPLYSHSLFPSGPFHRSPSLKLKIRGFYAAYERLEIIRSLAREAENLALEDVGLPKVGEGWTSETALFKKLEDEFSSYTKVIHHGQPTWLGQQHFDVWMPHWKIAVEYHGIQHFEPVEFFGGREAFEETRKRDRRKMILAEENGVKLFVIDKDSDQEELVERIRDFLKMRKVPLKPIR